MISLPSSKEEKRNRNARMITLLDSKPKKSNQNSRMITLLDSKPKKSNQNAKMITLLDSKPEKSNQNAKMITLLDSKPEKSNQNSRMITLLDSKQEKSNQNTEMIFPPSSKKRRKIQSFKMSILFSLLLHTPPIPCNTLLTKLINSVVYNIRKRSNDFFRLKIIVFNLVLSNTFPFQLTRKQIKLFKCLLFFVDFVRMYYHYLTIIGKC